MKNVWSILIARTSKRMIKKVNGGIKMDLILQIILIVLALIFVAFILTVTKRKQLSYRYTLLWLFFSLVIVIIALFPQIIMFISNLVHIETPANTIFLMAIGALIIIIFFMTIGYTKHSEKITRLVQANAILEKRLRDIENKKQ